MKIHRRIVATGHEWKPCCECGQPFGPNEILTAVDLEGSAGVIYWFCERCTQEYFGHLLRKSWRQTWRIRKADGSRDPVDWKPAG